MSLVTFGIATALLAQAEGDQAVNPLAAWLPFILVGLALYFLLIRPQKRRAQALRDFQGALSVGDEVRTAGGIIGRVTELGDDSVRLDVDGVTLRFARGAVVAPFSEGSGEE